MFRSFGSLGRSEAIKQESWHFQALVITIRTKSRIICTEWWIIFQTLHFTKWHHFISICDRCLEVLKYWLTQTLWKIKITIIDRMNSDLSIKPKLVIKYMDIRQRIEWNIVIGHIVYKCHTQLIKMCEVKSGKLLFK